MGDKLRNARVEGRDWATPPVTQFCPDQLRKVVVILAISLVKVNILHSFPFNLLQIWAYVAFIEQNIVMYFLIDVYFSHFFNFLFIYYVYNILQARGRHLITDGCEPPCGCWELNSGPLEEQAMLLTTEPSLQPLFLIFLEV